MRLFPFFLLLFFLPVTTRAQDAGVQETTAQIRDKSLKGFAVCLELDARSVESAWQRYIRSLGRTESPERNTIQGLNLMLPQIASDAVDFYSRLTVTSRCVQVFLTAFRAGTELELPASQKENVRKMLGEFAREQYRQDLKKQMAEAERVVNLAVKAHDKRMDEGQNIRNRIARNHRDKERLRKELEENARDLIRLRADSAINQSEQETALEEIKKVRGIAEEKKQKLGQIR
jgi:hypothetical protein